MNFLKSSGPSSHMIHSIGLFSSMKVDRELDRPKCVQRVEQAIPVLRLSSPCCDLQPVR